MLRRYMFAGQDEPILWDEGSALNCNGTHFLHTDHQGSVVAVADCWGGWQSINTYDEYGIPGGANQGRFQYTGQAYLPELGMYHYKAQIYSPTLGRFIQTDPIGYDDQINLYAYVANDPVNGRDPTGKCTEGEPGAWCIQIKGDQDDNVPTSKGQIVPSGIRGSLSNVAGDFRERVSNAWDNWKKGKQGEDQARQILRQNGYVIIGEQVYVKTSYGLRITDFVTSKGDEITGWEAKAGFFAVRSAGQIKKDGEIERSGGTIQSRGALAGDLAYGKNIRSSTGVISILDLDE